MSWIINWIKEITGKAFRWLKYPLLVVVAVVLAKVAYNSFFYSDGWLFAVRVWAHQGYYGWWTGEQEDRFATNVWLVIFLTVGFWVVFGVVGAIWEAIKRQANYRKESAKIKQ